MTDMAVDDGDDNVSLVAGVVEEVGEEGDAGSPQLVGMPGNDDNNTLNSLITIKIVVCPMNKLLAHGTVQYYACMYEDRQQER